MEEYAGNSHKSRQQANLPTASADSKTQAKKVVVGNAKVREKSGWQKFAGAFITKSATDIQEYIIKDVIIPSVKKGISDVVNIMLYGDTVNRSQHNGPVISGKYWRGPNSTQTQSVQSDAVFGDIAYTSRADAEAVLQELNNAIASFGIVSMADLYEFSGVATSNYALNSYGWTNLTGTQIVRMSDGSYIIKLPKAHLIKQ